MTGYGFTRIISIALLVIAIGGDRSGLKGDSIYSLLGIGESIEGADVRFRGMGDTGTAVMKGINLSYYNPAVLSNLEKGRISLIILPKRILARGNTGEQLTKAVKFPFLRLAFPLPWNGVISGGFFTGQDLNYNVKVAEYFLTPDISFTESWTGEGSINDVNITYAQKLGNRLSLGLGFRYRFGSSTEEWMIDFDADDYRDTYDRIVTEYRGAGYTAGFCSNLPGNLTVGASYISGVKSSANETVENPYSTYRKTEEIDIFLPHAVHIGMSYNPWNRLLIGVDFRRNFWSEFTCRDQHKSEFIDSDRYSFGTELFLGPDDRNFFYTQFPLRLGLSWGNFPILDSDSHRIREIMGSAGTGYTLPRGRGTIDIAVQFIQRGHLSKNPIQEEEWSLSLGFSSSELWSRKI
jgi:long-subunit fatty acid transport protein